MTIRVKLSRPENLDWFSCLPETVVAIDMEDYVAAVVASEIGNAPLEACKAQAVAARTYAMPYVGAGKQITDQSGTHQAFRASRWDAVKYPGAAETARATEGEVLTYKGGVLKTCSFSASNGGRTVSSEARWGGVRPYLIERDDPWDAAASAGAARREHGVGMSQVMDATVIVGHISYTIVYPSRIGKTDVNALYYRRAIPIDMTAAYTLVDTDSTGTAGTFTVLRNGVTPVWVDMLGTVV